MSLRQIFKTLRLEVLFFWGVSAVTSAALGTMIASLIFRFLSDGTNDPGKMASLPFAVMIAVFATLLVLLMGAYLLPIRSMAKTPIAQDVRMKE
jgi:predicted lysophospholipase L1 biosynthesis ABC-type transport system permease subunit